MSRMLITGGTGFLGRGIMRHAQTYNWDAEFIVYSRDEYKQYKCSVVYPRAHYVLGDIKDYDHLSKVIRDYAVDTVIHTAAIKFIPEAEFNVEECISVNIEGSRNVLRAAYANHVQRVIGISTDKACAPINVYGMTKAVMERLFGEYSEHMYVAMARYGNVIGSTGSVIPKFKEQLKTTGHVTLTSPDMTRYWISIDEAVQLIELAMRVNSGSIVIPKPRAMTMQNLANTLVAQYYGSYAGIEDHIELTGMRPGEKQHEALIHKQESIRAKSYSSYYELVKVQSQIVNLVPFELRSDHPEGGWLTSDELLFAIKDAEKV